jgi:hypothetical protein
VKRALALALSVCACAAAPRVLWRARSVDRMHELRVFDREGRQVLALDGVEQGAWDAIAVDEIRWTSAGPVVPVMQAERWRVFGAGSAEDTFDAIADVRVAGAHVAYQASRRGRWVLVVDGDEVAWSTLPIREIVLDDSGSYACAVVQPRRSRWQPGAPDDVGIVVRDGSTSGDLGTGAARAVALGAKGRVLAYVVRMGGGEALAIDHGVGPPFDEILEVALAEDEPHYAALVAEGERTTLLFDGRRSGSAALLTHLRISDDGAHVACLAPAVDGTSIEVWLDGASIATHRRVDGEGLAFVPGTGTLVYVAEESQGPRVVRGGVASERYEEIDGPVYAPGRVGWIGRRGGRSEVTIEGEIVATEEWAGTLRLASEGTGYAYVARADGQRAVVTRRGRWPVPRLFVDTLVVDTTAHHWAAVVPDAHERVLAIWIDGEPRTSLDVDEISGAIVASEGAIDPADAVRAIAQGELERSLSVRSPP